MKLWQWYKNISFMKKMGAGFALGMLAGLLLGEHSGIFNPLGQLFLNLLKMIVIPLVALSLMVAVNHSNPKELGRIGLKIFPFYLITTGIAVVVGILWAKLTKPGQGFSLPTDAAINVPEKPSFIDNLLNMVPANIFEALTAGNILAVVFVSLVFGLAILFMRHGDDTQENNFGEKIYQVVEAANAVVAKILAGILQYAPIGVFGITANTFGSQGFATVIALSKFIITSYLGVISLIVIVFPLIMKMFGIKPFQFYKDVKDAMFTAFATSSSLSTLPVSIAAVERAGVNERIARLTLPIGATVNMNGTALRFGVAVIFAAEIVGISMGVSELATIVVIGVMAAVGTAAVPGAGLIGMSIVFAQAGLPIEIVALTAGVNVLLDMILGLT
ncbi:Glutamate-aspartate carrier protein [Moraxella caviae]|uniref:Glutamate-aspartate carrier protein n=1 Tax=Moraxella caviae TaxID=34060 RepID=A0A378R4P5_9GAMM|nr:dicarboxylate/amino acid:cation symporter [Moraxella caviae]STZ10235.1 Glutamate-aspartate carrier protein [Moraxella caviae]